MGWKEQVEKDMVKAGLRVTMHRLGLHGDVFSSSADER
jgi:hypothetical protein